MFNIMPRLPASMYESERVRALRALGFSVQVSETMQFARPTVTVVLDRGTDNFHLEAQIAQAASIEWLYGHDVEAHYTSWTTPVGMAAQERLETLLRLSGLRDESRDAEQLMGRNVVEATELNTPAATSRITEWPPYRPPAAHIRLTPHGSTRNPGTRRPTFMEQVQGLIPSMLSRVRAEPSDVRVTQDAQDPTRVNIEATVRMPMAVERIDLRLESAGSLMPDDTPSIEEKKEPVRIGKPPGRMLDI